MIFFAICLLYHVVTPVIHLFVYYSCIFSPIIFCFGLFIHLYLIIIFIYVLCFIYLFLYFILPSYKINNSLIFIKSAVYVRPNIPNIERHTPKREAAYEYSYHGIPWWLATKQ